MSLTNASDVSIQGHATLNAVQRDQVNQTISAQVIHMYGSTTGTRGSSGVDEYEYVKQGHIKRVKRIHSEDASEWKKEGLWINTFEARRTIDAAEIHTSPDSPFTAVTYTGRDAFNLWQRDFEKYSRLQNSDSVQLFGYNCSKVPVLIFYDDLVPISNVYRKGMFWMSVYLSHLLKDRNCETWDLWINSKTGLVCNGPRGPYFIPEFDTAVNTGVVVPSTVDMLTDETSLRYFSKLGSALDRVVLEQAARLHSRLFLDTYFPEIVHNYSQDIGWSRQHQDTDFKAMWLGTPCRLVPGAINSIKNLRFDTLYRSSLKPIARYPDDIVWSWVATSGLKCRTVMGNGLTRFKLITADWIDIDGTYTIQVDGTFAYKRLCQMWLSQAFRIFSAHGTPSGDEEHHFMLQPPNVLFEGRLHRRQLDLEMVNSPVYLFVKPLPLTIPDLLSWTKGQSNYFWSYDEQGKTEIPPEKGIPKLASFIVGRANARMCSWPARAYDAIRKWQVERRFDPTTADFAHSLGYPELEIIGAKERSRSQEVIEKTAQSFWTAFAGSDISAFAV
ncbi:hypothetical protein Moror_4188 [Moniliophthora roreri MCA 2997]|uniref:Uncharacterized protein n=2 Tax=Moniliophthora roreri TaxID=221103 RepID=V2YG21_MONRO|nr:hypothetical protein Moror_4188 [Moniliophthora roreri MCA 2997]KAI3597437.1 hypothetical protein WG66_013213 [Moniliophthora roreri]